MAILSQSLITKNGFPRELEWRLACSLKDFLSQVDALLLQPEPSPAPSFIGLSVQLSGDGSFESFALSARDKIVVYLHKGIAVKWKAPGGGATSQDEDQLCDLLASKRGRLVGIGMPRLAMHLRDALRVHVRGVDIGSVVFSRMRSSPGQCVAAILDNKADSYDVDTLWDTSPAALENEQQKFKLLCLRAWISVKLVENPQLARGFVAPAMVDTTRLTSETFDALYKMIVEVERLDNVKARQQNGEFSSAAYMEKGQMVITNDRYKTRVRSSATTRIVMRDENDKEYIGRVEGTKGKQTTIKPLKCSVKGSNILTIQVKGKEERTLSEKAQDEFLLQILEGKRDMESPDASLTLIQHLWFPDSSTNKLVRKQPRSSYTGKRNERLNDSQAEVVDAMINSCSPFILVHGPPGTGKTSTISIAVQEWIRNSETAWIVAQSNVGVKNVAERLWKDGVPFRLIVSKEFYFEWHEHIYDEEMRERIIRTDEIPSDIRAVGELFKGVHIALCTLSTLSNSTLETKAVFKSMPMKNMIVDEASQIGIFNYMHLFAKFKDLKKVCFFGDPKQLPPFGQEAAKTLECIFDVKHLQKHAYFLNTQYRMPEPLGSFISKAVYDSNLQSVHNVKTPKCIAFVDANLGTESKMGQSFKNDREVQTIIHLVQSYYKNKDYCILTPYDAQRAAIECQLKKDGLRWDNVYNVDSFQGNEADYVLVSVVRTSAPGFLSSRRRVNVMLTRCKAGMVIVTNKAFMHRHNVRNTLIAELCAYWEYNYGSASLWHGWKDVLDRRADLPGLALASGTGSGRHLTELTMDVDDKENLWVAPPSEPPPLEWDSKALGKHPLSPSPQTPSQRERKRARPFRMSPLYVHSLKRTVSSGSTGSESPRPHKKQKLAAADAGSTKSPIKCDLYDLSAALSSMSISD